MSYYIFIEYKDGHIESCQLASATNGIRCWENPAKELSLTFLANLDLYEWGGINTLEDAHTLVEEVRMIDEYLAKHPELRCVSSQERIPRILALLDEAIAHWDEVEIITV